VLGENMNKEIVTFPLVPTLQRKMLTESGKGSLCVPAEDDGNEELCRLSLKMVATNNAERMK